MTSATTNERASRATSTALHTPRNRTSTQARALATCATAIAILGGIVVFGALSEQSAIAVDFASKNLPPCLAHPFGTDWMGRDMLARTAAGLSTSVLVGLVAASVSSAIALALGTAAALGGKKADAAIGWLVDFTMGIPHIVLLILISYALGKGYWGVTVGVALTHWPNLARIVRAEIMQCRSSEYVEAAKALGKGPWHIATRHTLPFVLPQFLTGLVLTFPHAILHEASITFLGFGLPPEQPAIGVILSESMGYLSAGMWWLAVFPGLALVATVLLFEAAGSSVRSLADAKKTQG